MSWLAILWGINLLTGICFVPIYWMISRAEGRFRSKSGILTIMVCSIGIVLGGLICLLAAMALILVFGAIKHFIDVPWREGK